MSFYNAKVDYRVIKNTLIKKLLSNAEHKVQGQSEKIVENLKGQQV